MKKEELTFKESWLEGKYKETLNKEDKKAYKRLSIPEKKKVLAEFKAKRDKVKAEKQDKIDKSWDESKQKRAEKREANKGKPFYKRHKKSVIAVIVIAFLAICGSFMQDSEEGNTKETKQTETKQTEAKPEKKEKIKKVENKAPKKEDKKEVTKKPLTDEQKIKKEVKKEVTSAKVKEINVSDYATTTAMIELEGKENLTDKMTSRSMKMGISETLHALKDTGVEFENVNISVKYPLDDGLETTKEYVIKSSWSGETISKMNDDNKNTLPDSMEQHAESYWEHPAVK